MPFSKRLTKWILFVQSVCYPIKWLYTNVLTGFMKGGSFANYSVIATYNSGDQVIYNFGVWESLTSGNTGNQPDISPAQWLNVNSSFIGISEQAKYTGNYLPLTYALNRNFQTIFRQPPYPVPYDFGVGGTFPDIYITNDVPVFTSFVLYPTNLLSSDIYPTTSAPFILYDSPVYPDASSFQFKVHFPLAVYNSLGIADPIRNSIINRFINQYCPAGIGFSIVTY